MAKKSSTTIPITCSFDSQCIQTPRTGTRSLEVVFLLIVTVSRKTVLLALFGLYCLLYLRSLQHSLPVAKNTGAHL